MKPCLFICLCMLAGCVTPPPRVLTLDDLECQYEAERATAGLRVGMGRSLEKVDIERQCLRVRAARRAQGAQ